ncbi:hypothetical protein JZU48_03905, partial [bacterium]|nr:hypothetical protein [bacterium]
SRANHGSTRSQNAAVTITAAPMVGTVVAPTLFNNSRLRSRAMSSAKGEGGGFAAAAARVGPADDA